MPVEFEPLLKDSGRLAAWETHYLAKGCNHHKAKECAFRKRHGATWPPKPKR